MCAWEAVQESKIPFTKNLHRLPWLKCLVIVNYLRIIIFNHRRKKRIGGKKSYLKIQKNYCSPLSLLVGVHSPSLPSRRKAPTLILCKSISEFVQVIGVFILRNSYNLIMNIMNKHRSVNIKDAECVDPFKFAKKEKKLFTSHAYLVELPFTELWLRCPGSTTFVKEKHARLASLEIIVF